MYFRSSVQTEHHVAHFLVAEFGYLIVQQHSVGSKSKTEVLACFLFATSGIGNKLFYHVPVHQRFAAEEIYFQIVTSTGMLYKKIKSLLAYFKSHKSLVTLILSLTCEAVGAV